MIAGSERFASQTLGALQRYVVNSEQEIARILRVAELDSLVLDSGIDRGGAALRATIVGLGREVRLLGTSGRYQHNHRYLFSFETEGHRYFFSAKASIAPGAREVAIDLPASLYCVERRSRPRERVREEREVSVVSGSETIDARILDLSEGGARIEVGREAAERLPYEFRVSGLGEYQYGRKRHVSAHGAPEGWARVGLSISSVSEGVRVEETRISDSALMSRAPTVGEAPHPDFHSEKVSFSNSDGQEVLGILDSSGGIEGALAFVVPSAWGQVKETMSPIALTILATLARLGQPVVVLRYDGTNRTGESYIDPGCRHPGQEYLRFRFSRAAADLTDAVRYLSERAGRPVSIVSTSLSAIEVRKALSDSVVPVAGWVSIVGVADLQSTLQAVSGGIDYERGLSRGLSFGLQEILGVLADIDFTGRDALKHRMATLEDARREMARIQVPIVWLHGDKDTWIDYASVKELLRCGEEGERRIMRLPTGHRLQSGARAMSVFRIAAGLAASLALGRPVEGETPARRLMARVRSRELEAIKRPKIDGRRFWRDYLLGRQHSFGMELLCRADAYHAFIRDQIGELGDLGGAQVVDLGAGLGKVSEEIKASGLDPRQIVEVDLVWEALRRNALNTDGGRSMARQVVVDLDMASSGTLPFRSASFDAAIASLLMSYLGEPLNVLREAFRLLRSGGRMVISSLDHDADPAILYADGVRQFVTEEARQSVVADGREAFERGVRDFLNMGAQLFRLADLGYFRFYSPEELARLLERSGFIGVRVCQSLGSPAQASIATGIKP